jgi:hypothetical protein
MWNAFGSYAGELFKLVDQARHGFGKFGHSLIHFQSVIVHHERTLFAGPRKST